MTTSSLDVRGYLDESIGKYTPLQGNICKSECCNGKVVKEVLGIYRGEFKYSIPTCQNCGRLYFLAENVSTKGKEDFVDKVNQPFTV
jgi:hypothetical protein